MEVQPPLLLSVLGAAFIAQVSPGPATAAIAREAMVKGRSAAIRLALGVTTGSWAWSVLAAGGLGAIILAQEYLLILVRIAAAVYLGWLAWRSARATFASNRNDLRACARPSGNSYARGLFIHLTNPKAILFFGALYSLALPRGASIGAIALIVVSIAIQSLATFLGLAILFSHERVVAGYRQFGRMLECLFAAVFGSAAVLLTFDLVRAVKGASKAS
ncbi:hypothetical protein ASS64_09210 [Erythrobacter sp. AP23]|nr:hypothetical protein ASS64_09210 [Erythrobacter sp. AP23]